MADPKASVAITHTPLRVRVRVRGGFHSHAYNDEWMLSNESSAHGVP